MSGRGSAAAPPASPCLSAERSPRPRCALSPGPGPASLAPLPDGGGGSVQVRTSNPSAMASNAAEREILFTELQVSGGHRPSRSLRWGGCGRRAPPPPARRSARRRAPTPLGRAGEAAAAGRRKPAPTPGLFPPRSPEREGAAARSRPHPAAGRDPLLFAGGSLPRSFPRGPPARPAPRPPPSRGPAAAERPRPPAAERAARSGHGREEGGREEGREGGPGGSRAGWSPGPLPAEPGAVPLCGR